MIFRYVTASALLFMVGFNEVTSWTIDLPEARKFFFSKLENENRDKSLSDENRFSYDNIRGNSLHNKIDLNNYHHINNYYNLPGVNNLHPRTDKYAEDYKYQGYMEKKIQDVLNKGTVYLDGLRYSIERYTELLEVCNRTMTTVDWTRFSPFNISDVLINQSVNFTNIPSITNFTGTFNGTDYTNVNFTEILLNFAKEWNETCGRATEKSEHVRRLADLALWTTKRLEDNAYAEEYHKNDDEKQEKELILRLAWYLDRLAHLTGFDPNIEDYVTTTTPRSPTPVATMPSLMPTVPPEVIRDLMACLKQNSTEPATVRCAYPLPLPDLVQQIINMNNNQTQSTTSPIVEQAQETSESSEPIAAPSSSELLIAAASGSTNNLPPNLTAAQKTTNIPTDVKVVRKRSIDENTLMKFMKYYAKHKVWVNSNPLDKEFENINGYYEVSNDLPVKSLQKRSLAHKKSRHLRLSKHRFQGLTRLLKNKGEIHYPKGKLQTEKVKEILGKMRKSNTFTLINNLKHKVGGTHDLTKDLAIKNVHKRSIDTKNNVYMKLPEDPMQDLSKYVKSKAGAHYNNDKTLVDKLKDALQRIRNAPIDTKRIWRHKRSLVKSNVVIHTPPHYPEKHPIREIGKFIHHKAKEHIQKHHVRAHKIKETLDKLYHASAFKHNLKSAEHLKTIHKRSVDYGTVHFPRKSENPYQDISYYIKNKEGVNYNRNVAQAVQVRAGLEQVFQTGDINVIRRYGANYNPLIPNVYFFGVMKTISDI